MWHISSYQRDETIISLWITSISSMPLLMSLSTSSPIILITSSSTQLQVLLLMMKIMRRRKIKKKGRTCKLAMYVTNMCLICQTIWLITT